MRFLLLVLACWAGVALADAAKPTRVLVVGNSYVSRPDLAARLERVGEAMGRPVRAETFARDDYSLEDHWAEGKVQARLREGWDYVILQQGPSSSRPAREALARDARRFAGAIRAAGARPVLLSAWPQQTRQQDFTGAIAAYRAVAAELDVPLIPTAEAWLRVMAKDDRVRLYSDGLHAADAGAQLAALTTWFTLFPAGPQDFNEAYVARMARALSMEARGRDLLFDAATRAVDEPLELRVK